MNTAFGGGAVPLQPAHLWCAMLVGVIYALFYLLVLDRLGVHLYPIFSPRTHWCAVAYSVFVGLYFGAFRGWNAIIAYSTAGRA